MVKLLESDLEVASLFEPGTLYHMSVELATRVRFLLCDELSPFFGPPVELNSVRSSVDVGRGSPVQNQVSRLCLV